MTIREHLAALEAELVHIRYPWRPQIQRRIDEIRSLLEEEYLHTATKPKLQVVKPYMGSRGGVRSDDL